MKKILLVSNYVFHYRIKIYNYFFDEFKKNGYEFHVLSNEYQDVNYDIKFKMHKLDFSINGYINKINEIKPDVVINFLHLKDKLIIPLTYYCKFKKIPMIYWNHGINLRDPNNKIKNAVFHFVHNISSSIILYTPNEIKYIKDKNRKKTFIAYNTLNFNDAKEAKIQSKAEIKKKYNIKEEKVIMYISRVLPYKKLDVLLNNFKGLDKVAIVVVGDGISEEQLKTINENSNMYYLGAKYGKDVWEIFNMGDIYSTPGHIGLGLNEAFYWGKPVVILEGKHAPEIYYLENGVNGYITKNENELKEKCLELLNNDEKYKSFSENCKDTYEKKCDISNMFNGFMKAINYCLNNKEV